MDNRPSVISERRTNSFQRQRLFEHRRRRFAVVRLQGRHALVKPGFGFIRIKRQRRVVIPVRGGQAAGQIVKDPAVHVGGDFIMGI
jgi:hypothetical protein